MWDDSQSIGRRVLKGRPVRPWPRLTARRIVLLASDADAEAGVAAVWLVRRPGSARQSEETWLFERGPRRWDELGGGVGYSGKGIGPDSGTLEARPSVARNGPGSILTRGGGAGVDSNAGWVTCEHLRVAAEVQYVQAGERRITVPEHGYVIVVWKRARTAMSSGRPPIAAIARDGSVLSELGPSEYLDSVTLGSLEEPDLPA
jgi:hypothetical protein